ncbi:MAG: LCP family protein [Candidatus Kerfeldbacteria bacterium]|nr:LCP family protein [Candidatus Kerfeldbacteria bacterium]
MASKRYTTDDYDETVDLLSATEKAKHPKRHPVRIIFLSVLGVIIVAGLGFAARVFTSANSIFVREADQSVIGQISGLFTATKSDLRGYEEDRINLLLMGHGGPGHPGSYLSDTNILVSVQPSTSTVAMVSIPRDLAVEIPGHPAGKINNALAFGFQEGKGEELMIDAVESVTGQTVHYFVRVDFTGFEKVIDDLGGVTVNVEKNFYDPLFPNQSYGYAPVSFKAGEQTMDGERALQYARSRHGNNGEGSDFARSKRQQQILFAMKEKTLSAETLLNPASILAIVDDLGDHLATNMTIGELQELYQMLKNVSEDRVINEVIDSGSDGLLLSYISETTGAYLLSPKAGTDDFSEIQERITNIFTANPIKLEHARVDIQNGTRTAGLAREVSEDLERQGIIVGEISNAQLRDRTDTVIYIQTTDPKPETLKFLEQQFSATSTTVIPDWVQANAPTNSNTNSNTNASTKPADFILVVGERHEPVTPAPLPNTTVL